MVDSPGCPGDTLRFREQRPCRERTIDITASANGILVRRVSLKVRDLSSEIPGKDARVQANLREFRILEP